MTGDAVVNMMSQVVRVGEELWHTAGKQFFRAYDQLRHAYEGITSRPETTQEKPVAAPAKRFESARVPEGTWVYAIGDIHGRADLLVRLFDQIEEDAKSAGPDVNIIMVFLGDYVDRGFQSKDVIDFLLSDRLAKYETVFIKGNHEDAFVKFLTDAAFGPDWAKYGGAETLTSYGIRPPRSRTMPEEWFEVCDRLNAVLPAEHRTFLTLLKPSAQIGDYMFVHAGVSPDKPLDMQVESDLLWIRDGFLDDQTVFECVIVHGHTPINEPHHDHRRIGVDTGAYLTGKLTAARLIGEEVTFFTT